MVRGGVLLVLLVLIGVSCVDGAVVQKSELSSEGSDAFLDRLFFGKCYEHACRKRACDALEVVLFKMEKYIFQVNERVEASVIISSPCFDHWTLDWGDKSAKDSGTNMAFGITHRYQETGVYKVKLCAFDKRGNKICRKRKVKVIEPCEPRGECGALNIKSLRVLGESSYVNEEVQVFFKVQSDSLTEWKLNWGDDSETVDVSGTKLKDTLGHIYENAGEYFVTLTAFDSCGDSVVKKLKIFVNEGCVVKPECDTQWIQYFNLRSNTILEGKRAVFSYRVVSGKLSSVTIDFGDGTAVFTTTDVAKTVKHKYRQAGKYTVRLTVKNQCGDEVRDDVEVEVVSEDCAIPVVEKWKFGKTKLYAHLGLDVEFEFRARGYLKYEIDWNDGTEMDSGLELKGQLSHVFSESGQYKVLVKVWNCCGNVRVFEFEVDVQSGCHVNRIRHLDVLQRRVYFGQKITLEFLMESLNLDFWRIDWGDNSEIDSGSNTQAVVDHLYESDGKYEITVYSVNTCGDVVKRTKTVRVIGCKQHEIRKLDVKSRGSKYSVEFNLKSSDSKGWTINWGDGSEESHGVTRKESSVTHEYLECGEYWIVFSAENECGEVIEKKFKAKVQKTSKESIHSDASIRMVDGLVNVI
uniref:PKD domain-containing protein n=1 Tax=Timspurckia oligopyrenoides TaxID=708627 RepID=A0A7S0ZHH0_9RHOD|mmetsp:Transcript_5414/g.9550  ORF Transcript_5414/g.9550 Transcript_5414/m.9550 type:complete len:634 (+) Transcript_5414:41-1942(+)|eukprot:CAMPEP_0182446516 /NCGR_PEP_ID=MMETSP1172-20130603/4238_1 /TAXON_ID=708627 /ORGANISM="Timspurckia oligopyrenoides, Strain CCMP3278" /LENGTH=633 /DNA_ID=CAMNT_0024642461 /DNA_START=53 /DNA_END=1954 /DNA_ORIENTATION=-